MNNLLCIAVSVLLIALLAAGCKKTENQPVPKAGAAPAATAQNPHGSTSSKTQREIVVPDDVKKIWKKVVLIVEDKQTSQKKEYTAEVGSEINLAGSNLKIKVLHFLPHFMMQEGKITSLSNEPKNPAVKLQISENNKVVFDNWLYSRHTDIHAFEHSRYGIILKEGLRG
ncbi:MAG: hypothetical protein LLF86_06455 [Nitrospiraceae bacterium]|nr:hypothetical protein [Nitrospiraceae bacterium]